MRERYFVLIRWRPRLALNPWRICSVPDDYNDEGYATYDEAVEEAKKFPREYLEAIVVQQIEP